MGIRCLFKKPLPYSGLLVLQQQTNARGAYLGSSIEHRIPHHKLTLLFDCDDADEKSLEVLFDRMMDGNRRSALRLAVGRDRAPTPSRPAS